jgi:hypothetical protein
LHDDLSLVASFVLEAADRINALFARCSINMPSLKQRFSVLAQNAWYS